ncbi:transmembrane protein 70 homolog, mitochondrial isoform X2 [Ptiloglossa arizonensis]|uniref:transmembrane protein 70 homolog, mitochondrial isoform X2 n=1 Tax=Ptiloglossa arizonensis TaxID=3350558 RepID=UPI003F9F6379
MFSKFTSALQIKHFSKESEKSEKILIYTGTLSNKIRNIKIFSYLTSFGSLLLQPLFYMKAIEDDNMIVFMGTFGIIGMFAIFTPLLIYIITKKYVTDLYYYPKEDSYLAKRYSMFLTKNEIKFTTNDVHVPDISGMFYSCNVKGIPLFFNESDFKDVAHYFHIMGYYKPIDFKLDTNVNQIKTIKENENL